MVIVLSVGWFSGGVMVSSNRGMIGFCFGSHSQGSVKVNLTLI